MKLTRIRYRSESSGLQKIFFNFFSTWSVSTKKNVPFFHSGREPRRPGEKSHVDQAVPRLAVRRLALRRRRKRVRVRRKPGGPRGPRLLSVPEVRRGDAAVHQPEQAAGGPRPAEKSGRVRQVPETDPAGGQQRVPAGGGRVMHHQQSQAQVKCKVLENPDFLCRLLH